MQQLFTGTYYFPANSQAESAEVRVNGDTLNLYYQQQCILATSLSLVSVSSAIPGVAQELSFKDGGKFVIDGTQHRLQLGSGAFSAEALEKNKKLIFSAIFLVPLLLWFSVAIALPNLAAGSVKYLPDSVAEQMGRQTFYALQKTILEPSELDTTLRDQTITQWQQALEQLGLSQKKFQLHVFKSDYFGANAFALPNGTVVITDQLLILLKDKPNAVLAILLHEIGHVEHQHSLRMIAQSVSSSVAIALIFGDLEGFGEVLIGTGSTLLQNAFSREMESEADQFALNNLVKLGKPPMAFAEAMQSFLQPDSNLSEQHETDNKSIFRYLSTHPDINERIHAAEQFQPAN